ncbi:MAG: hypothetical protein MJZ86_10860 [Bacteroidales bacterium]|nr:hypothetical protein [Bacteroidales bacterium]
MTFEVNEYLLKGIGIDECWQGLNVLYGQCSDDSEGLSAEKVAECWNVTSFAPRAVITNMAKSGDEICLTVAEYDHDWMPFLELVAGKFGLEVC